MDELVDLVVKKVGIPKEQAEQAIKVILDFLKKQLPEPLSGQIDGFLKGDVSGLEDLAGGLGKLFG